MDGRFLKAWTDPAEINFLGRKVYPFCLKYRVRLLAIESPLVTDGVKVTPLDLLVAVKICAEEPLGPLGWRDKLAVFRMQRKPGIFLMDMERFIDYVQAAAWPKFWTQASDKRDSAEDAGIPWPLLVVCNLMKAGHQEKRAWEMPECQAIWYNAAIGATNGSDAKVLTTEEEGFMDELEQAERVALTADVKTPRTNGAET